MEDGGRLVAVKSVVVARVVTMKRGIGIQRWAKNWGMTFSRDPWVKKTVEHFFFKHLIRVGIRDACPITAHYDAGVRIIGCANPNISVCQGLYLLRVASSLSDNKHSQLTSWVFFSTS